MTNISHHFPEQQACSQRNTSLFAPFAHLVARVTSILKYWRDGCMGRPPPQILRGPSFPIAPKSPPMVMLQGDFAPALTTSCYGVWSLMHLKLVGHGGALVEAITLNRRVVGSTPALAAM